MRGSDAVHASQDRHGSDRRRSRYRSRTALGRCRWHRASPTQVPSRCEHTTHVRRSSSRSPPAPQPRSEQRPRRHQVPGSHAAAAPSRRAAGVRPAWPRPAAGARRQADAPTTKQLRSDVCAVQPSFTSTCPSKYRGSVELAEKRPYLDHANDRRRSWARQALRAPCLTRRRPTLAGQFQPSLARRQRSVVTRIG